jgi:hypothetical protein
MSGILKSEFINRVTNGQHVVQPVKWWSNLGQTCQNVLLVKLTPELAEQLWNRNRVNRKFKERIAARYAKEMKEGRWVLNGETIIFNTNGDCVQGQHRIAAVMKSRVTVWVYMVFDVDPAAFMTMDSGAKRSAADQLGVMNYANPITLAGAAALYHKYASASMCYRNDLPNTLCLDVVSRCPGLSDSVAFVIKHRAWGKARPSVLAVAHYLANEIDPDLCDEFFSKLFSGSGVFEGDPELTLTRRLELMQKKATRNSTLPPDELYCFAVAWNAKRDGRKISLIRVPADMSSESFPKFR